MKLLIVVDAQNDFIDGALGNEGALMKVPNICEEIKNFDGEVIFTQDTHFENDYFQTQEGKKLSIIHCVKNTKGWEINDDILYAYTNKYGHYPSTLEKYSFGEYDWASYLTSIFGNKGLDLNDLEEIELIGYCTDVCVISNAMILKALFPDVVIKVKSSCCSATTKKLQNRALDVMRSCQIEVI